MESPPRAVVLGLGNDLLGDDGIGLIVAREVRRRAPPGVEVVESGEAGLALIELLMGYQVAVIVDAIRTGAPPGTLHRLDRGAFDRILAPSAHYAGLAEVFDLAERLRLPMPSHLAVVAVEVEDPYSFAEHPTASVADAVVPAAEMVLRELEGALSPALA
jgi:hydrogenase maturation protease